MDKIKTALRISASNDDEKTKVEKIKKLKLTKAELKEINDGLNKMSKKKLKEGTGMRLETVLNEVSREITKGSGKYRIQIETRIDAKQHGEKREFTFEIYKLKEGQGNLRDVLQKSYGNNVVKVIISKLAKAISGRTLDSFAKDDIVDFIITGDKVKFVAKTKKSKKEDLEEDTIELSGNKITINGKPYNGTLRTLPMEKKYKNLIANLVKKYGKDWHKNFQGDDGKIDITNTAGQIKVNKD